MGKLWMKDNKLLFKDGKLLLADECCCGQELVGCDILDTSKIVTLVCSFKAGHDIDNPISGNYYDYITGTATISLAYAGSEWHSTAVSVADFDGQYGYDAPGSWLHRYELCAADCYATISCAATTPRACTGVEMMYMSCQENCWQYINQETGEPLPEFYTCTAQCDEAYLAGLAANGCDTPIPAWSLTLHLAYRIVGATDKLSKRWEFSGGDLSENIASRCAGGVRGTRIVQALSKYSDHPIGTILQEANWERRDYGEGNNIYCSGDYVEGVECGTNLSGCIGANGWTLVQVQHLYDDLNISFGGSS